MLVYLSVETGITAIRLFGLQDYFFNLDNFSDLKCVCYSTAPTPTSTLNYSSTGEEEVLQREVETSEVNYSEGHLINILQVTIFHSI